MQREAIIIGGPNGSGKSTFAEEYLEDHDVRYLCADAIAAELDPEKPDRSKVHAGRTFIQTLRSYIDDGHGLMIESTLSGLTMRHIMDRLHHQNYLVTIIYLFIESPDICVDRVRQRVLKGGHAVSEADVRRRYVRSKKNFWNIYRKMADRWYIYHNAGQEFHEVACCAGGEYHLVHDDLFRTFQMVIDDV